MMESEWKYFKPPLEFREPKTDSDAPQIYDSNGQAVAYLLWPFHPGEETSQAEQETYRLGRLMASSLPPVRSHDFEKGENAMADKQTTCQQHGHQYNQAGTAEPTDVVILYCVKCADVQRIPVKA